MNEDFDPKQQGQGGDPPHIPGISWKLIFWLFLIFLLVAPWLSKQYANEGTQVSYSDFRKQVQAGNVASVTVQGEKISGDFKNALEKKTPDDKTVSYTKFYTYLPSFGDDKLLPMLEEQKVNVITEPRKDVSWWAEILVAILPFLILIGVGVLFYRGLRAGGGQNIF